jgi:F0F1-type ATP synthase membrane subunit b/b'
VKLRDEIVSVALNAAERMVKEKLDRTRQSALVDQFLTDLEKKA